MLPMEFFPAVGRNQTLLTLIVLHSVEFSSDISEQRNSLPLRHGPGPIPEVLAADLPQ